MIYMSDLSDVRATNVRGHFGGIDIRGIVIHSNTWYQELIKGPKKNRYMSPLYVDPIGAQR